MVPRSDRSSSQSSNILARLVPPSGRISNEVVCLLPTTCQGRLGQAGKYETLCNIQADLSTAPYQTGQGNAGRTYYTRNLDMILLVGLTELKAQIGWIDSVTVSFQGALSSSAFLIFVILGSRGWRKG
jgi:hypothetical protein